MSRENAKSDNRCPVCGGRMRLVNVTWVNRFNAPEASLYDLSVSRRKALLKKTPASSAQEWMCFSCTRRSPMETKKTKKAKKDKTVKTEKKKDNKKKGAKKKFVKSLIGWLIFLAILAVTAYFVYNNRDIINGYIQQATDLFNKATEFIGKFQK